VDYFATRLTSRSRYLAIANSGSGGAVAFAYKMLGMSTMLATFVAHLSRASRIRPGGRFRHCEGSARREERRRHSFYYHDVRATVWKLIGIHRGILYRSKVTGRRAFQHQGRRRIVCQCMIVGEVERSILFDWRARNRFAGRRVLTIATWYPSSRCSSYAILRK